MNTWTARKIGALTTSERRRSVSVGDGLTIRIHPSGRKSWVFRIWRDGRVVDETIGHWPEMSLKHARQAVREKRKRAALEPPAGFTLRDAFRLWCAVKKKSISSYSEERRRIERHVMSVLGRRQIDEITAPLVIAHLKSLEAEGKQATLKRLLMRTREIMSFAVCAGYVKHNPLEDVSRVFSPPKTTPMPALHWRELDAACGAFVGAPDGMRLLFLFSTCSMLRPGENAALRWSWIEGDVITIPAEAMKKRKAFRVPVTPLMARLLNAARGLGTGRRSAFVFPGRERGKPVSSQALAKYLHSSPLSGRLVAHGLRSMARSYLADHEAPFEVAEMCLAHAVGSSASRAYQRSDYLSTRRDLMANWSKYVEDCARRAGLEVP